MPQRKINNSLIVNHDIIYPTDLSDAQWTLIEPLIPPPKPGGRHRDIDIRQVINAIFYLLRSGCAWRMIPKDYPDYGSCYNYFRKWKQDGTWKKIHDKLRDKVRLKAGRKKQPSAGIIDSQSVKTTEKGGFVAMTLVKR